MEESTMSRQGSADSELLLQGLYQDFQDSFRNFLQDSPPLMLGSPPPLFLINPIQHVYKKEIQEKYTKILQLKHEDLARKFLDQTLTPEEKITFKQYIARLHIAFAHNMQMYNNIGYFVLRIMHSSKKAYNI